MASIIKASINLTNVPKDKIIQGRKGKYLPSVPLYLPLLSFEITFLNFIKDFLEEIKIIFL